MKKMILTSVLATTLVTGVGVSIPEVAEASRYNTADYAYNTLTYSQEVLAKTSEYKEKIIEMDLPSQYLNRLKYGEKIAQRDSVNGYKKLKDLYDELDVLYKEWESASVSGSLHSDLEDLVMEAETLLKSTDGAGKSERTLALTLEKAKMVLSKSVSEGEYNSAILEVRVGIQEIKSERKYRWTEIKK